MFSIHDAKLHAKSLQPISFRVIMKISSFMREQKSRRSIDVN